MSPRFRFYRVERSSLVIRNAFGLYWRSMTALKTQNTKFQPLCLHVLSFFGRIMQVESSNPIPSCRSSLTCYYKCLQIDSGIIGCPENGKMHKRCTMFSRRLKIESRFLLIFFSHVFTNRTLLCFAYPGIFRSTAKV